MATSTTKKWTAEVSQISEDKLKKLDAAFEQTQAAMVSIIKENIEIGIIPSEAKKMLDKIEVTKDFITSHVIRDTNLTALTGNFREDLHQYAAIMSRLLKENTMAPHDHLIEEINAAAELFHDLRLELTRQKSVGQRA